MSEISSGGSVRYGSMGGCSYYLECPPSHPLLPGSGKPKRDASWNSCRPAEEGREARAGMRPS